MNEIQKQLLKVEEILKAPDKSRDEQYQALSELITRIMMGEEGEEPTFEKHHWPGMYKPKEGESYITLFWNEEAQEQFVSGPYDCSNSMLKYRRATGESCETEKEAEFIRAHQEAKLAVIDRLAELNGDWRTGETMHFEPRLNSEGEINIVIYRFGQQGLPDWFHARYREYWDTILGEFGEEKVKLALWPKYEE